VLDSDEYDSKAKSLEKQAEVYEIVMQSDKEQTTMVR